MRKQLNLHAGKNKLVWLPVVIFSAAIPVLYFLRINSSKDCSSVILAVNLIFCSSIAFTVAYLAARSYLINADRSLVFIGSSMLVWGARTGLLGLMAGSMNAQLTFCNIGVAFAGLFSLTAAVLAFVTTRSAKNNTPSDFLLVASYVISTLLMITVALVARAEWLPPFFILDKGPTLLRQVVLGIGVTGFALSAVIFRLLYRKLQGAFLHWYSLGMVLLSIGLIGVWLATPGNMLNLVSRSAQFLAGPYILVAVISLKRAAGSHLISLESALSAEDKVADKALRDSEQLFRLFLDNSPVIAWVKDEAGRYVYFSFAFEQRFGVRLAQWRGKSDRELWPPAIADQFRKNDLAVLASGEPMQVTEETLNPDGSCSYWLNTKFLFHDVLDRRYVAGIGLDITERIAAMEMLRKNEENLRRAQSVGNIGSWRLNFQKNEVVWSDENYRIFGVPKDTPLTYESFLLLVHPDDRAYVDTRWKAAMAGDDYDIEHRIVVDGNVKWVREKAYLDFDEKGSLLTGFGITQDITEKKDANEILQRNKEILEQLVKEKTADLMEAHRELDRAKRLADIGVLAATVAHELRNPLAAIGIAAFNIKRKAGNPDLDKHLVNIDKKVAESNQIINNLLFYSRLRPPHLENINIFNVLTEIVEAFEEKNNRRVSLVKNIDSLKGLFFKADPHQIKEVFNNILNNSYDAVAVDEGIIVVYGEVNDEDIFVFVEDNGHGIAPEVIDKIFDPFFTTKAKGTGLGLSVSRQIISVHDGEIRAKQGLAKGACIFVRLPRKARKKPKSE